MGICDLDQPARPPCTTSTTTTANHLARCAMAGHRRKPNPMLTFLACVAAVLVYDFIIPHVPVTICGRYPVSTAFIVCSICLACTLL